MFYLQTVYKGILIDFLESLPRSFNAENVTLIYSSTGHRCVFALAHPTIKAVFLC